MRRLHFSQEKDVRIEIKLYICGREDDNINIEDVFEKKTEKTKENDYDTRPIQYCRK